MKRLAYAAFFVSMMVSVRTVADAPADRYMINASQGIVTDLRTGLTWQHPANTSTYTWDQAASYCRGLSIALSGGFRVPTLKELLTLVDPTRIRPAIDLKAFPNAPAEWFWTASNRASAGPAAVSFATGGSGFFRATDALRVRCVR
jgi:hypothetical protein